jgi:hypothetical protein
LLERKRLWIAAVLGALALVWAPVLVPTEFRVSAVALTAGQEYADDVEKSRAFMTEYGVSAEVQDRLIADALSGKTLMADQTESVPVSTEVVESSGSRDVVSVYSDGSIKVVESETPAEPDGVGPMDISGCSTTVVGSQIEYRGCSVHYQTTSFSFFFLANYTILRGATTWDHIDRAYGAGFPYAIGWQYAGHELFIGRRVETSSARANAQIHVTYTNDAGTIGRACGLTVGRDTATYYNP